MKPTSIAETEGIMVGVRMVRRRVVFRGQVQGVGFRYTTQAISRNHQAVGFVRNLPDRTVELVVEGDPAQLNKFQQAIETRMGSNIEGVSVTETQATGEFTSFDINF